MYTTSETYTLRPETPVIPCEKHPNTILNHLINDNLNHEQQRLLSSLQCQTPAATTNSRQTLLDLKILKIYSEKLQSLILLANQIKNEQLNHKAPAPLATPNLVQRQTPAIKAQNNPRMVQTPASAVNNRFVGNSLPAVNPRSLYTPAPAVHARRLQTSVPAVNYQAPFLPQAQHDKTSPNPHPRGPSLPYIKSFMENLNFRNVNPSENLKLEKRNVKKFGK
jgi:hypothetical protein